MTFTFCGRVPSASGNFLELFKSDLDKCQSLFPIRGWRSALNCNSGLFSPPPLPLLVLLILSPTFPLSASDQMVWNKSIYKGIRVKQPCLVLLAAKHWNKSLGMMKAQSFSLNDQVTQPAWKGMSFYSGPDPGWSSSCQNTDKFQDTFIQRECDVTIFKFMFICWHLVCLDPCLTSIYLQVHIV